jgi:hypothetical protein
MNGSGFPLKTMGAWLIAVLPMIVGLTALFTYSQPLRYFSHAVVEVDGDTSDFEYDVRDAAQDNTPVIENTPGSNRYSVGFYSADASDAAAQANDVTETALKEMARTHAYGSNPEVDSNAANLKLPSAKVWERAEPSLAPTRPNVVRNMSFAWWLGSISAAIGFGLLIFGSNRKAVSVPVPVAVAETPVELPKIEEEEVAKVLVEAVTLPTQEQKAFPFPQYTPRVKRHGTDTYYMPL